MLHELRQHSRSFIIWILFGIIIVVFVISFGPQANAQLGCGASKVYAMKVKDREIGQHTWRFAMNGLPYILDLARVPKPKRAEVAMDFILERELLAQAAEDRGFRISTDLINEKIKHGEWYLLGRPVSGRGWFFDEGVFSYDRLESAARSLGLPTVEMFIEQQRRELLAQAMRGLIMGSVQISKDELLASFEHQHTRATIDYVKFRPADYKRGLVLSDAEIEAYAASHEDAIKEKYDADAANYKDVKPQAHVRQIFFERAAPEPAKPANEGTAKKPKDDGKPAPKKEVKPAEDPAKKKADKAHAKLVAGADFATLAEKLSDDERTAKKGGDLGWRTVSAPGLGNPKLGDALAKLKAGEISDVIDTPRGFYILRVDELREGDLSLDQVRLEIADDLARTYYAREDALRDAEAALAELRAGKKMEDLFEREAAPTGPPPGLDIEELRKQLPPGTNIEDVLEGIRKKQGSVIVESKDIPAESKAEPETSGDDKAADERGSDETAAKTGDDEAASAGESEPEAKKAEERPPADMKIPRPADVKPPKLRKAGPFTRNAAQVPGVGESADLVKALFGELGDGQLGDQVYEVDDGFVLVQLVSREEPDLDVFAKTESDLRQSYVGGKGFDTLREWVLDQCHQAVSGRQVIVNKEFLSFNDDNGKPLPITYQPCGNL